MARLLQIFSRRPGGGLPNSATFLTGGDGPQIYLRQSFSSYWRGLSLQQIARITPHSVDKVRKVVASFHDKGAAWDDALRAASRALQARLAEVGGRHDHGA